MPRPTMKEISNESMSDEVWEMLERRVRKSQIVRERNLLRRQRRIKPATHMQPTKIVSDPKGLIKCVGGQTYSIKAG